MKDQRKIDKQVETLVKRKIAGYKPQGNLDHTARVLIFNQMGINHHDVKMHSLRLGLLVEAVAGELRRDKKAHLFCGILHDVGKETLPYQLFDGHNINQEEYEEVKRHAVIGSEILSNLHLFCSVVSGIHHHVYQNGYGIDIINFPRRWSIATIKKSIDTGLVVSIADFIDAATHRKTEIKDGGLKGKSLRKMLCAKYPDDTYIVDLSLEVNEELNI